MENYPYSYPDSHDSSPRSSHNESWDDQQQQSSNYKVKFMCSYGGKIHPRPHDNQLAYVGGETKILSVDRNIKFSTIVSKLSSLSDYEVCFKYQLPGEDLDALISVTNEEDLEHMMLEYDRLYRVAGSRPARLRLFLFPVISSNQSSFSADDANSNSKPSQQWFVDALNSVPSIQSSLDSSPPDSSANTDFLFGYEKQQQQVQGNSPTVAKLMDPKPELPIQEPKVMIGSDVGRDDRNIGVGGESMFEIQRQIQELQRLQIVNQHEQQQQQQQQQQQAVMYQRKQLQQQQQQANYHGDYYMPEKQLPLPLPTGVPVSVPVSVPQTAYWQQEQRQTAVTGGYSDQISGVDRQQQQQSPMYMMPSPAGMYQTSAAANVRPVTGHVGHGYYGGGGMQGMQRVIPDVYREQPVYSMGPPPTQHQIQPQQPQAQMTKMMAGDTGGGYTTAQVAYDSSGRQVYYTTTTAGAPTQVGGVVPSSAYQTAVTTMSAVDPRQSGLNQDSKVVKPPQGSL